tara:strand:+ start:6873 stop:7136 length:264 start_codon:yes stop_codon:yes gene_type:complete
MYKIINILMLFFFILFIFSTFKYYASNTNIKTTNFNRININEILKEKMLNLPILQNDTNNVIEFNDTFNKKIKEDATRSFWNLLKFK